MQAVVDTLSCVVDVRVAERHPGIFDADELARVSIKAPCILLSTGKFSPDGIEDGECWAYTVPMTLYCIAMDQMGSPRIENIIDDMIAPLLGAIGAAGDWGVPEVWSGQPSQPSARSLYGTLDDRSLWLAIWAVEWTQSCRVERRSIAA